MDREEILKNLVEEFYEDFNECERAQHLLDCEYCELYKKYGRCHLGEYITGYQMPIIEKAQADLLKEFVEFAKGEFIKANYCYNDTYLDTMLDMFLEERENG